MKEHFNEILRLSAGAVFLAAGMAVSRLVNLPMWAEILLFALPYLITGIEVLLDAARGIFKGGLLDEAFLMSIATLGAFFVGEYPEAVFVMLFYGIGELFEDLASDKSRKHISELMDIKSDTAYLVNGEDIAEIPASEIEPGDILMVKAGGLIPADGTVIKGESSLDMRSLTGESIPFAVSAGCSVFSGSINLSGVIYIKAADRANNSTAAKILELVENAADKKAKTEKFITRFSRIYTPVVVGFAAGLAVIASIITGDYREWIYRSLMFLAVSCPCALVVSVPLAFFSGIGAASKKGILIKGGDTLEALCKVKTAVFDKTGTLTHGTFAVTAVHPQKYDEAELLRLAAAAESGSDHPIALSLKTAAKGKTLPRPESVTETAGLGISAVIDGKKILVGSGKFLEQNGIEYKNCHRFGTVVHVAAEGEYCGHIVISDTVKPSANPTVSELKASGIETVILTGDTEENARAVFEETGADRYFSSLLPADKVSKLEDVQRNGGVTVFTGDGINDAPVLARADIGVAMGAIGSDAAIEAADVVIMDDNLTKLPLAVKIAAKACRIAKQNTAISITVKIAVLLLSAFGISNMWFAAFADVGVLILAVLNSVRALKA